MSFEIKLFVGQRAFYDEPVYPETGEYEYEVDVPYPRLDYNNPIPNAVQQHFIVFAMVDLAAPGHYSNIAKLYHKYRNNDEQQTWYFFQEDGNNRVTKDQYDTKMKPAPLDEVVYALKVDAQDNYRRFTWALGLLESMLDNTNIEVLLYGH